MKKIITILSAFFSPAMAFAANPPAAPITNVQGLVNLECTIFDWMFYFLMGLSVIMILIAAFNYVTAGDNSEKVSKATKMITYAAIGIAVALLAKAVPTIVSSFLGAGTSGIGNCT